jgi:RNA polymerase sigma factor (TIGR02999 family)
MAQQLYTVVYGELKRIAKSHRRRWRGNETLNTTALLNEAFIKLSGGDIKYISRSHFFATASKAMRQVLINYAEQQRAEKRGGDALRVPLENVEIVADTSADEFLSLHAALSRLEGEYPRRARVVECRVFGGMSIEEVADALDISPATVKREWQISSAWLYRAMRARPEEPVS